MDEYNPIPEEVLPANDEADSLPDTPIESATVLEPSTAPGEPDSKPQLFTPPCEENQPRVNPPIPPGGRGHMGGRRRKRRRKE